jgi:hypothetical protein
MRQGRRYETASGVLDNPIGDDERGCSDAHYIESNPEESNVPAN